MNQILSQILTPQFVGIVVIVLIVAGVICVLTQLWNLLSCLTWPCRYCCCSWRSARWRAGGDKYTVGATSEPEKSLDDDTTYYII